VAGKRRTALGQVVANWRYRFGRVAITMVLLFLSIVVLFPFIWVLATSLREPAKSFSVPPELIPKDFVWGNYREVFRRIPFWKQMTNSFFVATTVVVGQVITASLAGYAFAHLRFPGKTVLFWVIMATMMIPLQATIIPVFVLITKLGLADHLEALILPSLPTAFGTFLLRQYFLQVPGEFEEAAKIDGASDWTIFSRVYLPLVRTGQAVLAVLVFNGMWNEFFRPLIFLTSKERFTITLGLNDLKGYMETGSISVVLAGIVLATLPVVAIYLAGQRFFVEGIMMGGLKG